MIPFPEAIAIILFSESIDCGFCLAIVPSVQVAMEPFSESFDISCHLTNSNAVAFRSVTLLFYRLTIHELKCDGFVPVNRGCFNHQYPRIF